MYQTPLPVGTRFEGTLVELTGTVNWIAEEDDALTLETNNPNVDLFVSAPGDVLNATFQNAFVEGDTYTLQLYISEQEQTWLIGQKYLVISYRRCCKNDYCVNCFGYPCQHQSYNFEGKVVEVTATVRSVGSDNDYITLQTNNDDVRFWVKPFGNILEGTFQRTFIKDQSYTLQLYIEEQESNDSINIWSYLVK